MQQKIAYIDGFAKALEDNGVSPGNFFKEASHSNDPSIRKLARLAEEVLKQGRQQPGEKTAANPSKMVNSSWLKRLFQKRKKTEPVTEGIGDALGGKGKILHSRPATGDMTRKLDGTPTLRGHSPVPVRSRTGKRAKQYSAQRAEMQPVLGAEFI